MINAKQIEFTYRNNSYVQACACISQRSLSGSELLHFFLFCLWSCLPWGASLCFGSHVVLHRLIFWALDLVKKFGTQETLNLSRTGICKVLIVTKVEQPSWVRWATCQATSMSRHWGKGRYEENIYPISFKLQDFKLFLAQEVFWAGGFFSFYENSQWICLPRTHPTFPWILFLGPYATDEHSTAGRAVGWSETLEPGYLVRQRVPMVWGVWLFPSVAAALSQYAVMTAAFTWRLIAFAPQKNSSIGVIWK